MQKPHNHFPEHHFIHRSQWLRAAVLGANDGILSTASIITGVAAGQAMHEVILLAGLAGLVAGATSMATGEYVSVSSQSDIEHADLKREKRELKHNPEYEQRELAAIYVERGLEPDLAAEVAKQLTAHDALAAHARDELGISDLTRAKPVQAALASAASFTLGGALPLLMTMVAPLTDIVAVVTVSTLLCLAILGAVGAKASGMTYAKPVIRVVFWGAISMACAALVGHWFGVRG